MNLSDIDKTLTEAPVGMWQRAKTAVAKAMPGNKHVAAGQQDAARKANALYNEWQVYTGRTGITAPKFDMNLYDDDAAFIKKALLPYIAKVRQFLVKAGYNQQTIAANYKSLDKRKVLQGTENASKLVERLILKTVQSEPDVEVASATPQTSASTTGIPGDLIDAIKQLSHEQQQLLGKTLLGRQ